MKEESIVVNGDLLPIDSEEAQITMREAGYTPPVRGNPHLEKLAGLPPQLEVYIPCDMVKYYSVRCTRISDNEIEIYPYPSGAAARLAFVRFTALLGAVYKFVQLKNMNDDEINRSE